MRIGSLCTGYGGLDIAAQRIFGGQLVWWSDVDEGAITAMKHHYPDVPNLGDLKIVDWSDVEPIDLLSAGYPCQPFSNAGKRLGLDDQRHLWPWIAYAIAILRPRVVVLENVAAHRRRGFPVVASDLAALGYDASWGIVRASDIGAPHKRERIFVVAHAAHEHDHRPRNGRP
jgi:DNA (cytosine-5)-methyltransferase 1